MTTGVQRTTYTLGPWKPLFLNWGAQIVPDTRKESLKRPVIGTVSSWTNDPREDPQARANARLIAAAPELLTTLQRILALACDDGHEPTYAWKDAFEAAERAVYKATGTEP